MAVVVFALPQPEPPVTEAAEAAEAAGFPEDARLADLKNEAVVDVESRRDFTQQMVDMIFSFNELGFQEFETQRYVTRILEDNGFTVELGVAGIPSAWWASWGSGAPVIALGTDVDGLPQASQKPGVASRDPLIIAATNLASYTQADLNAVAQRLNSRPRKTLGYATPADRLANTLLH